MRIWVGGLVRSWPGHWHLRDRLADDDPAGLDPLRLPRPASDDVALLLLRDVLIRAIHRAPSEIARLNA